MSKEEGLRLLRKGKVKDIYELDDERLVFDFSNRVSAFDVILPSEIPNKGKVLCQFGAFWFESLNKPHHMIRLLDSKRMVVKRLKMIPIEFVVRGYLYGSLYERMKKGEIHVDEEHVLASRLKIPMFDPTTKSEEKDLPLSKKEILDKGLLTKDELNHLEEESVILYFKVSETAWKVGFMIADIKFEFGVDKDGRILLADSIGPDEFRLWEASEYTPGKVQESFDKQLVRDWLIRVGYKDALDKARKDGKPVPPPPKLPQDLVEKVGERYVEAYERITGRSLMS